MVVLELIIAKTRLKKIPDKCINCKFCMDVDVKRKATKTNGYLAVVYMAKKCFLTGIEVPYVYNSKTHDWEYIKCKKCPLFEMR